MTDGTDPLVERINTWSAEINDPATSGDPVVALQGWALREELKRRPTPAPALLQTVESHLKTMPTGSIPVLVEHASRSFTNLLNEIDREEPNLEHVRRQSRDVFFSVLDALVLTDDAGDQIAQQAARKLFNQVISEVYVFEPVADLAAELERWGRGAQTTLSDLLCTAVSRLFDGRAPVRNEVPEEVEEFVPVREFLLRSAAAPFLTLVDFAQRLGQNPWWYLKWAAQRLRVSVTPKTRELRLEIFESDLPAGATTQSRALDGWELRAGHARDAQTAPVKNGLATLRLPDRIDPAQFQLQARNPDTREWVDLHARLHA
jgi:hypothetical protein